MHKKQYSKYFIDRKKKLNIIYNTKLEYYFSVSSTEVKKAI